MDRINILLSVDSFTGDGLAIDGNKGSRGFPWVIEHFFAKVPDPKTLEVIEMNLCKYLAVLISKALTIAIRL